MPGGDPARIRADLKQYGVLTEDLGGAFCPVCALIQLMLS